MQPSKLWKWDFFVLFSRKLILRDRFTIPPFHVKKKKGTVSCFLVNIVLHFENPSQNTASKTVEDLFVLFPHKLIA